MPEQQQYKRRVAKEKTIGEIEQDDIRVKVLGKVIDKKENIFILDDGSGSAEVMYDPEVIQKNFNINDTVKVFARILLAENNNVQLQAEALQNINDLNLDLYRRIKDVVRNV